MARWDEAEHINFRVRFIEPVVYRALEKQVGGARNLDDHANAEPPSKGAEKNPSKVKNTNLLAMWRCGFSKTSMGEKETVLLG